MEGVVTNNSGLIKMEDEELAAIRAKCMEELQTQYGICPCVMLAFLFNVCLIHSFLKFRSKCSANATTTRGYAKVRSSSRL